MDNVKQENLNAENISVQGANAQEQAVGTAEVQRLGKFKTVDALLDAYNSLEAEFTRRSQRLKELEGKTLNGNAEHESASQEMNVEAKKYAILSGKTDLNNAEISLTKKSNEQAEACVAEPNVEGGVVKSANDNDSKDTDDDISEEIKEKIIAQYLSKIRTCAPNVLAGGGVYVGAPKARVKTLDDAAKQATDLFKRQGSNT